MKKLFFILFVVIFTTNCIAQVNHIVADSVEWRASKKAMEYRSDFYKAITNPGKKILVEQTEKFLRLKSFFKKEVKTKDYFIIYNQNTKNIDYLETEPLVNTQDSHFLLFDIFLILFMITSNILFKKEHFFFSFCFAVFAISFFVVLVLTSAIAIPTEASVFVGVATFIFTFLFIGNIVFWEKNKSYKILSIIFYSLIVVCNVFPFFL